MFLITSALRQPLLTSPPELETEDFTTDKTPDNSPDQCLHANAQTPPFPPTRKEQTLTSETGKNAAKFKFKEPLAATEAPTDAKIRTYQRIPVVGQLVFGLSPKCECGREGRQFIQRGSAWVLR